MFKGLLTLACLVAFSAVSQAHFLWLVPGDKPHTVKVIFSDKLAPDTENAELINRVQSTTLYVHDPESKHIDLKLEKVPAALVAEIPENAQVVRGRCGYGVFQRGENPSALLNYYCIYKQGTLKESGCFNCQPFQVREETPGAFLVEYEGDAVANSEVVLVGPEGFQEQKGTTDKQGKVSFDLKTAPVGLYGVRARHIIKEAGEHQGKKYEQITNYVTLVFRR
jgi:hypothetical protein